MSGIEREPGPAERLWVALADRPLPSERAQRWASQPSCGAVVSFTGTVRDHAPGRPGVTEIEYEAYDTQVEPRLERVGRAAMERWPGIGRVVIWHRTGTLAVGEASVLVVVSAAHRQDAFEGARYCIDTVKTSVPVWKRERWEGGEDWGVDATEVSEVGA